MVMLIVELVQALPWNLRGVIDVNDPFKSCVTATCPLQHPQASKPQDKRSKNEDMKMAIKAGKMHELRMIS